MSASTHATEPRPATTKQLDLIRTMISERTEQLKLLGHSVTEEQLLRLSTVGASRTIDKLKQLKRDSTSVKKFHVHPGVDVGFYVYEGLVVKVKHSQRDGRLYTSILQDKPSGESSAFRSKGCLWVLAKLTPEHEMTREQAAAYGSLYGRCACCGKLLTVDESIEKGIGPDCWKKYFG